MNGRVLASFLFCAAVVSGVACGGAISPEEPILFDDAGNPVDTGKDGTTDTSIKKDTGLDGKADDSVDTPPDIWVDPPCPDTPAPPPLFKCDPHKPPPGDCKAGQGCYPWVEYPDDPCEHERYRADCFPAGSGKQGDPCSSAACAPGYACVASGAGNVCVKMCKPGSPGGCPDGLVCHATDVPGVGACF